MKVIVCEKCFNIPKITIKNKDEIQLECQTCKSINLSHIDYFNKYININEKDDLNSLPNCNFKEHNEKAILYCFKCSKYLCNYCLSNHNAIFKEKGHLTIKQKINHKYFCEEQEHEENILNRFCLKCNKYLCCDCKCEHNDNDIYNFNNIENDINAIKNNILKCQEIIEKEEIKCNNLIKKLQNKIQLLTNLFNDYKKRNNDLISFYKLLIDNYEQIKNLKNYNLRNNIFINNNFDLRNSVIYKDECLISNFNRLCEFYRNTIHIKTQEFIDYYITPKDCKEEIKKAIFLNSNISVFMFERTEYLLFTYKNKNNENKFIRIYHDDFIKNIYPLNNDKLILLDEKNNLKIAKITIDDSLNFSASLSFKDIQFVIKDIFNKENYFTINTEKSKFFILKYNILDENKNNHKIYENSKENDNNMYLIIKENKIINDGLYECVKRIINDSNINQKEKDYLNLIFNNLENAPNIQNLINLNIKFLDFIDSMNINIYNKIKEKLNINENKYNINSNYIMKYLPNLNKNDLNQNEINEVNNACNINQLCKKIMETYIHLLIFNSKINNVHNYKNKFLLFMGEQYLFIAFSLKTKKFFGFESSNLIKSEKNNYNNYEIIKIISNKIIINNNDDKIINIIENDNTYNFCLVNNSFKYHSSALADNNYLLYDIIEDNNLNFILINLDNYSIENNIQYDFCQLLNFKINNEPPKLYLTQNFSKFIYLYEDNNQISIINLKLNKELEQNNNELINKIDLKRDNQTEIIPIVSGFSSIYNNDYKLENVLKEEGYYCTKTNENEFITFKFDKEYCFTGFAITFPDRYEKARLKMYNVNIYHINEKLINTYRFSSNNSEIYGNFGELNDKGAYIKFELLKNFGKDYFCIERIKFFADITHSLK